MRGTRWDNPDSYRKWSTSTYVKNFKTPTLVVQGELEFCVFVSSRRRHTRLQGDWSSDVCSSDLSSTATTTYSRSRCLHKPWIGPRFALPSLKRSMAWFNLPGLLSVSRSEFVNSKSYPPFQAG